MIIPPELLSAISVPGGGRLAIVIGAGCSVEAPTAIPLAGDLSEEASRRLINNGVLAEEECKNPRDLAALASLVYGKVGSQMPLVRELPIDNMRTARPNSGYLTLVGLMAEQAITHVLSLNFDLAVQNAAADIGEPLSVVDDPKTAIPMSRTVVYLHGSASSPPESIILRAEVINELWKSQWQQIVAQQILAAPTVLFVGLGSAAPVLSETVAMIAKALGSDRTFYQVDVSDHSQNYFAKQLGIPKERYIQATWCEIMEALGGRLAKEHVFALIQRGTSLLKDNSELASSIESFRAVAQRLEGVSLLSLGKLRAYARINPTRKYLVQNAVDDELLVSPLLTLSEIAASQKLEPVLVPSGIWHLKRGNQIVMTALLATGGGVRNLVALEGPVLRLCDRIYDASGIRPDLILIGGLSSDASLENLAPPTDIITGEPKDDIISGPTKPLILIARSADAVRLAEEWANAV